MAGLWRAGWHSLPGLSGLRGGSDRGFKAPVSGCEVGGGEVAKAKLGEKIDLLGGLESHYGGPRQRREEDGKLSAFIRHEDEIRQALEDGYTVKEVWLFMRERGVMEASYNTFTGYVRKRLGIMSGRIHKDGASVSVVEPEPVGSEGRKIDQRAYELVLPKPEEGGSGSAAERGEVCGIRMRGSSSGRGRARRPFNPSGG